ncbi:MAG: thioredoxin domain-containing protein, partial [Acidobacteria bacterium]
MTEATHTNALIHETSPYLLGHAHNPVQWFPWSEEALRRAREEDKPILLSIGYSACHWCHVMERESFENEAIARLMNENFVNIKVDREERPDLDAIYMNAVQMMTGSGGWPMTVFLTPDQVPFYGGTYFPPEDRHGMPGFPRLLAGVAQAYRERREQVLGSAAAIAAELRKNEAAEFAGTPLEPELLDQAVANLMTGYDSEHGGFGSAPKFPPSMSLTFLLRSHVRTREGRGGRLLAAVEETLGKMACGGIYDQLGGGFHRYSVDQRWLVPHFEKMLYDNALLSRIYVDAYRVTGKPLYRRVAEETLDYVLREMTSPEGGFYSTQDADSEGHEGKFFVWTPAEVAAVMGEGDAEAFSAYYDVTPEGNFEGKNILNVPRPAGQVARLLRLDEAELGRIVERGRRLLFAEREGRVKP